MNKISYDSSSVTNLNIPDFNGYYIISENDISNSKAESVKNKDEGVVDIQSDDLLQSKSWIDFYAEEWDQLFCKDLNIEELQKIALDGELRSSCFRSICWRCMLGILHSEPNQWLMELYTYRSHYSDLWIELQKNPWNVEKNNSDNPLSQEAGSIWQKYFSNEELKFVIHQDVVRTFPDVDFFRKETVQDVMVRILFCYARQNPSLCYRQGMHEILAPLIFVLHRDYQALIQAKDQNFQNSVIFEILDPKYIEEDAYSIFKHVMNHIECSYRIKNMVPTSTGYFTSQVDDDKNCENEVISRLQYIKENILQTSDPDLNKHLEKLDIPLHLFGIRWLRLLFGREFPFQDLLVLWDAIFAVSNFELVNYVVVSMLTAIRPLILAGDYTSCLTNLMHYPSGVDIMFVIEYALHLMNHSLYPAPTVTSFSNKLVTLTPKGKSRIAQLSENDPKLLTQSERLKAVSAKQTKCLSGKSHSSALAGSGEGDRNIIEGFALDDPKMQNLATTMELIHAKLCGYYDILRNNLPQPLDPDVNSALNGIHDLCKLLKAYENYSVVETASEAGETKQIMPSNKRNSIRKAKSVNVVDTKANTLPKAAKKLPSGELKVFKQCQGGQIVGAPMTDPLRLMKKILCECVGDEDGMNVD